MPRYICNYQITEWTRKELPLVHWRKHDPANTLISDSWTLEVGEYDFSS